MFFRVDGLPQQMSVLHFQVGAVVLEHHLGLDHEGITTSGDHIWPVSWTF